MDDPRPTCSRRRALRILGMSAASGLLVFGGCGPEAPVGPPTASVPLASLAGGKRIVVKVGETTVEVRRMEDGTIVARSLVCPHQGCVVQWQEAEGWYKCPCQGAWFDPDGAPMRGPVSTGLPLLPTRLEAGRVVVG